MFLKKFQFYIFYLNKEYNVCQTKHVQLGCLYGYQVASSPMPITWVQKHATKKLKFLLIHLYSNYTMNIMTVFCDCSNKHPN